MAGAGLSDLSIPIKYLGEPAPTKCLNRMVGGCYILLLLYQICNHNSFYSLPLTSASSAPLRFILKRLIEAELVSVIFILNQFRVVYNLYNLINHFLTT